VIMCDSMDSNKERAVSSLAMQHSAVGGFADSVRRFHVQLECVNVVYSHCLGGGGPNIVKSN